MSHNVFLMTSLLKCGGRINLPQKGQENQAAERLCSFAAHSYCEEVPMLLTFLRVPKPSPLLISIQGLTITSLIFQMLHLSWMGYGCVLHNLYSKTKLPKQLLSGTLPVVSAEIKMNTVILSAFVQRWHLSHSHGFGQSKSNGHTGFTRAKMEDPPTTERGSAEKGTTVFGE